MARLSKYGLLGMLLLATVLAGCGTQYTLAVSIEGDGAVTPDPGTVFQAPVKEMYDADEPVTLMATSTTGWVFSRWAGDLIGDENPATLVMDTNKAVTAVFVKLQYDMATAAEPADAGSVSAALVDTSRSYAHGQTVRLTANPAEGWEFDHWTGDLTGSLNPVEVGMTEKMTITAVFRKRDYDLSVVVSPAGAGTVKTVTLVQTRILHGQAVQMTACPNPGYLFDHWEGDLAGDTNPSTLAVNGAKSVTAVFIPWQTIDPPMRRVPGPVTFPTGTMDGDWAMPTVNHVFWLGETEITYEQWYAVRMWAISHGYQFANAGREGSSYGSVGTAPSANRRHPVTSVSFRDALVWCNALTEYYNRQYGASLVCVYTYNGTVIRNANDATACDEAHAEPLADGFRLATPEELELTARYINDANGNGTLESGEYYPGSHISGDTSGPYNTSPYFGKYAWYNENSGLTTQPVATKAPNALGLYDISGNVREWCFEGAEPSYGRFRGGSFMDQSVILQIGLGYSIIGTYSYIDIGFRIARNM